MGFVYVDVEIASVEMKIAPACSSARLLGVVSAARPPNSQRTATKRKDGVRFAN